MMSETEKQHLWEIDHPYYGPEGHLSQYKSWNDFLEDWKDNDDDMNFLIRWDWNGMTLDENFDDIPIVPKDDNYRAYTLKLFYVLPRKSMFINCEVEVCRNDEPDVIKFLEEKFKYVKLLWKGISDLVA